MMDQAHGIIANLTPFRGAGADPGTAYELGYMAAKSKLCLGYSNLPGTYADRLAASLPLTSAQGGLLDPDGLTVENFALADNLMLVHALDLHGAPLIVPSQPSADIWRDLTAFEACARMAAARLRTT